MSYTLSPILIFIVLSLSKDGLVRLDSGRGRHVNVDLIVDHATPTVCEVQHERDTNLIKSQLPGRALGADLHFSIGSNDEPPFDLHPRDSSNYQSRAQLRCGKELGQGAESQLELSLGVVLAVEERLSHTTLLLDHLVHSHVE